MADDRKKLSDGRNDLGEEFAHAPSVEERDLAAAYVDQQSGEGETVGDTFADPGWADRQRLGNSFADANSLDDAKLGEAFEGANSSGKRHRPSKSKEREPGRYRALFWFLAAVLVLFLVVFLVGYLPRRERSKQNEERAASQRNALPVLEVETVKRAATASGLTIPGTTTPWIEAFVYARSNGYLKRRLVDLGDHVRKGQLLAVIDSPDLDQQVDQAREQVRQAEAQHAQQETQLALALVTVQRYRALVLKGVFSRQDGDQREADFHAQEANVAAAERNVEAFKANLRRVIALQQYEQVTAPFAGVITARNVDVGSLISAQGTGSGVGTPPPSGSGSPTQAGSTNTSGTTGNAPTAATPMNAGSQGGALFGIAQVDRLRILVSVPEGYAGAIRTGQPASLHFQELPNADVFGSVSRTSASIDQNSRTLLTEVQVDNHAGKLMSGMYTVVTFAGLPGAGPVTIPGDAVAVRNDHSVVAVIQDGKVRIQPVELGRDFGPAIEVTSGLKSGDVIASNFTDDVQDGASVKTSASQTAGESATSTPPPQNVPLGGSDRYGKEALTNQEMKGSAAQPPKGGGAKQPGGSGSK